MLSTNKEYDNRSAINEPWASNDEVSSFNEKPDTTLREETQVMMDTKTACAAASQDATTRTSTKKTRESRRDDDAPGRD